MAIEAAQIKVETAVRRTGGSANDYSSFSKLLLVAIGASIVGFFCFVPIYAHQSIMLWAWKHWLPNLDQEHGKLVIPISALIVWYHRKRLRSALIIPSNWGWWFIVGGITITGSVKAISALIGIHLDSVGTQLAGTGNRATAHNGFQVNGISRR